MKHLTLPKVLLVDDNDTDKYVHKRIIELYNFSKAVLTCDNGKEALDYLLENEHNLDNIPDLIFIDINMPIMNGFAFLDEFEKLNPEIRNKCKQVIILSSSNNYCDINRAINNSVVTKFITKPLSKQSLEEVHSLMIDYYKSA